MGVETGRAAAERQALAYNFTNEGGVGGTVALSEEHHGPVAGAGVPAGLGAGRHDVQL